MTYLFIVLISHIIGDFLLQPNFIAIGRNSSKYTGINRVKRILAFNLMHCLIHGFVLFLCIHIFNVLCGQNLDIPLYVYFIVIFVHFFIDICKPLLIECINTLNRDINKLLHELNMECNNNLCAEGKINFVVFVIDQVIHMVFLFIICAKFFGFSISSLYEFIINIKVYPYTHDKILFIIFIILTATFEAAYFSKFLLDSIKTLSQDSENFTEAKSGGFIIGILERLFIILGIVMKQPSIIAVVLTLKSFVRYKKFGEDTFAEYYIIGTFLSFVIAISSGLLISNII